MLEYSNCIIRKLAEQKCWPRPVHNIPAHSCAAIIIVLPSAYLLCIGLWSMYLSQVPGFQAHGKYKTVGDPIDTPIHHFLTCRSMELSHWQSVSIYLSIGHHVCRPTKREASYPPLNLSNSDFSDTELVSTRFHWMLYDVGAGPFPLDGQQSQPYVWHRPGSWYYCARPRFLPPCKLPLDFIEYSIAGYIIHSPHWGIWMKWLYMDLYRN